MASSDLVKINCAAHLAERILGLLMDPRYSESGNVVVKCRDGTEKIVIRSIWRASSPILGEMLKGGSERSAVVHLDASAEIVDLLESCFHLRQKIEVEITSIIPLFAASVRFKIDILTADLLESFTLGILRQIVGDEESWMSIDDADMIHLGELLSQHRIPSFDRTSLTRSLLLWVGQAEARHGTLRKLLESVFEQPTEMERAAQLGTRKICHLRSAQVIRRIEFGRGNHSVTIDQRTYTTKANVKEVFRLGLAYSIQDRRLLVRRATETGSATLGDERRFSLYFGDFDGICNSGHSIYVWRSQEIFIVDPKHEAPPSKIIDTTFQIGRVLPFVKDSRDLFGVSEVGTRHFHVIDIDGGCFKRFPDFGNVWAISEHFALRQDNGLAFGEKLSLVKFTTELEIESSTLVSDLTGWKVVDVTIDREVVLCLVESGAVRKLVEICNGKASSVLTAYPDSCFVRCID